MISWKWNVLQEYSNLTQSNRWNIIYLFLKIWFIFLYPSRYVWEYPILCWTTIIERKHNDMSLGQNSIGGLDRWKRQTWNINGCLHYYRDCFTSVLHNALSSFLPVHEEFFFFFFFLVFKLNSREERANVGGGAMNTYILYCFLAQLVKIIFWGKSYYDDALQLHYLRK